MSASPHPKSLAYFSEATIGTGPTDAADWVNSGTRVEFVSSDVTPIKTPRVEDANMNDRLFDQNQTIAGIENVEASVEMYITGAESETADTVQVTLTDQMTILSHCLGGLDRGYSTTCTGGSTTAPEVVAATGIDEGVFLAFEDADDAGRLHIRRVMGVATLVITIDEALPFTPANGDLVHACATIHLDTDAIQDPADGSHTTFSWLFDNTRETGNNDDIWEINGSRAELSFTTLERGQPPIFTLSMKAGSYQEDHIAGPTWVAAAAGSAPSTIGPDDKVWIQDFGNTAQNCIAIHSLAVEVGVPVTPIETMTSCTSTMPGLHGWTTGKADTTITFVAQFDSDFKNDIDAGTYKTFRFQHNGDAGGSWAIHCSRCEVFEDPERQDASDTTATQVVLRAHPDAVNSDAGDANLWESKICIVLA